MWFAQILFPLPYSNVPLSLCDTRSDSDCSIKTHLWGAPAVLPASSLRTGVDPTGGGASHAASSDAMMIRLNRITAA